MNDWRQLLDFYQRLSARERTLVGLAGGALLAVVLYLAVLSPLNTARDNMALRINRAERQLAMLQELRARYFELLEELEGTEGIIADVSEGFSLYKHVNEVVAQNVGQGSISSMNPDSDVRGDAVREESVDFKLTGVTLKQLVHMLYSLEKGSHPLRVTRLNVKKRYRDPHTMDVNATVSMLQAVGG